MQAKPSIVFCHGIWADRSSFSRVIPPLRPEEREEIAAQYGLATNKGDVNRSGLVRRRSHSKSNGPSGSLTKKENSHERAY